MNPRDIHTAALKADEFANPLDAAPMPAHPEFTLIAGMMALVAVGWLAY